MDAAVGSQAVAVLELEEHTSETGVSTGSSVSTGSQTHVVVLFQTLAVHCNRFNCAHASRYRSLEDERAFFAGIGYMPPFTFSYLMADHRNDRFPTSRVPIARIVLSTDLHTCL